MEKGREGIKTAPVLWKKKEVFLCLVYFAFLEVSHIS